MRIFRHGRRGKKKLTAKEILELEKLEFEVKQLKNPFWTKINGINIILPLICLLLTFYLNKDYVTQKQDLENKELEIKKLLLTRDVSELQTKEKIYSDTIRTLSTELVVYNDTVKRYHDTIKSLSAKEKEVRQNYILLSRVSDSTKISDSLTIQSFGARIAELQMKFDTVLAGQIGRAGQFGAYDTMFLTYYTQAQKFFSNKQFDQALKSCNKIFDIQVSVQDLMKAYILKSRIYDAKAMFFNALALLKSVSNIYHKKDELYFEAKELYNSIMAIQAVQYPCPPVCGGPPFD